MLKCLTSEWERSPLHLQDCGSNLEDLTCELETSTSKPKFLTSEHKILTSELNDRTSEVVGWVERSETQQHQWLREDRQLSKVP